MGEYLIKSVTDAKDLDKGFASATKAIAMLGIKINLKKPDEAKIKLVSEKNLLKVIVDCKDYTNALGITDLKAAGVLDPKTQKAAEEAIALLDTLVQQGLKSKSEAEAQKADIYKAVKASTKPAAAAKADAAKTAPTKAAPAKTDPKLAKVEADLAAANKALEDVEARAKAYAALTYTQAARDPAAWKDMREQAKKDGSIANLDFLEAAAARESAKALCAKFIDTGKVHLDSDLVEALRGGDSAGAVSDVQGVVSQDTWRKTKNAKAQAFAAEKAKADTAIKSLTADRAKLTKA